MRPVGRRRWLLFFALCALLAALALVPGIAGAASKGTAKAKPTVVRELTELKTENSKTFLLSDGTRQVDIYGGPIQFKDKSGTWKDIDTALVSAADGSLSSKATPVQVKLSKKDKGAPVVSLDYKGMSLELALTGHDFALPAVEGNTATYALGADAQVTPAPDSTTEAPATSTTADGTTGTAAGPLGAPSAQEVTAAATTDTTAPADTTTSTSAAETTTTETPPATPQETTTTETPASPEVSLSYQVTPGGIKENITLASAAAPNSFTFTIRHPGLILRQDSQGGWGFYDELENPRPLLVMDAPVAYDSSENADGDPTFCPDPQMTVTVGEDESTITFSVPSSWLSDPARVFPVVLDPSLHEAYAAIDTFIESGQPNSYFYTLDHVSAGYFGGTDGWVTGLFKFDLPGALSNGYVQDANLYLRQYYQSTGTAQVARISAMTTYWIGSSTYSGLGSKTWFGSDTVSINTTSSQAQNLNFNVAPIVQKWADGTLDNQGFTMYQSDYDRTGHGWYRRVYSYNYANSAYWPKLTVHYTPQIDASLAPYSADKTGATDATSDIQDAIDDAETAGGIVYLPAGNYKVGGLNLDHSNLILRGAGDNTRLIVNSADQDYTLKIGNTSAVSNITVTNLYVRMPAGGDGIQLQGTGGGSNIRLTDLSLGGGADSAEHQAINVGSTFTDLTITGNDLTGVTALPYGYSASSSRAAVLSNPLYYQPYRTDFFGGTDRYETAIRMSQAAFPNGINATGKAAVVALGTEYPSVLAAGPLASAYSGPLLLNSSTTGLDDSLRDELQRLAAPTIFLVGLPDAVYNAVKDNLPACTVTKLIGTSTTDYVGTGTAVASQIRAKKGSAVTKVIIVPYNESSAQAGLAAVVPLAAKNTWPILFTPKTGTFPSGTSTWCTTAGNMTSPRYAVEVDTSINITGTFTGGVAQIDAAGTDTAWALAAHVAGDATNNCTYVSSGLASGASWADAALLGSYLGPNSGRLLLTDTNGALPSETLAALDYVALDYLAYANLPSLFAGDANPGSWVPAAPRHTTHDLGSFADHSAQAVLDKSALNVDTTDLEVASYGPRVALDRHYSSTRTTSGVFAPGWRFSFERSLDFTLKDSGRIDYVDEEGDAYTFLGKDKNWAAPPGFAGTLWLDEYGWWRLRLNGNTLTFNSTGQLYSEADGTQSIAQSTVFYYWSGADPGSIVAANGQQITFVRNGAQLTATYSTVSAGTRTILYDSSNRTVTYLPGTALAHSVTYTYSVEGNFLSAITANDFTGTADPALAFTYSSGALTGITYPDYDASTNPDARTSIAYDQQELSATITGYGRIYSSSAVTGASGTAVTQTYAWNPAGTLASKTNPNADTETWDYSYSPLTNYLLSETSPLGKTKSWAYNNRGNLVSETDELGNTTAYTYPDSDPLIQGFVDVQVSTNADDVYNADSTLRTTMLYQAMGHGSAVDSAGWRFQNVQIPKGAQISSAKLYLAAYYNAYGDPTKLDNAMALEANPNPGGWAAGTHEPRAGYSTLTSYATQRLFVPVPKDDPSGAPGWEAGNWYQSQDLKESVQEVVSLSGWTPGNAMAVICRDLATPTGNYINSYDFSASSTAAAHLVISYGLDVDPDPQRDEPSTVTDPRGNRSYRTVDKLGRLVETKRDLNASESALTRYSYEGLPQMGEYVGAPVQTRTLVSGTWNNLVTYPADLDNAAWTNTKVAVIPNIFESPLGRQIGADKIAEDNQSGTHTVGQNVSVTSGKTYRYTVYVHPSERQLAITFTSQNEAFSDVSAVFDIQMDGDGVVVSHSCEDAGIYYLYDNWWVAWAEQPAAASATGNITVGLASNGSVSYTGTGHSTPVSGDPGLYVWGAECLDVTTPVVLTTNYDLDGYWPNGQPKQVQTLDVALGSGQSPDLTVSQVYDEFGNLVSKTDATGQTTLTNTYDLAGRLLTSTGPVFKATSNQTQTQVKTWNTYDAWGHLTDSYSTSTGDGSGTKAGWNQISYDKAGRVSQVKNVLSSGSTASTIDAFYDGLGRLIYRKDSTITGSTSSEKLPALTAYDARGNAVARWAAGACTGNPATLSGYDLAYATRHLKSDDSPDYDAGNRVGSTRAPDTDATHPAGAATYTYYDNNRVKKVTNPDGTWTRSYYDANGNVIHTLDSVLQAAHPTQDENNPTYFLTSATYDYANRATATTDRNNLTTNSTYDLLGRQLTAGAEGQSSSQFTYNLLGWQLQIQDADGFTTSRVFDAAGRTLSETSASYTTTFTFQSVTGGTGLLSQKTEGSTDRQATYTYDWFGRTSADVETAAGTTVKNASASYDSLGRVSTSADTTRALSHSFTYPQNTVGNTTDAQGVGTSGADLVSTTLTIGPDGLEASRASTITSSPQVPSVTRSIDPSTGRDYAKRVTKATIQTDTSRYLYQQYAFDSAGRIIKQWGPDSGAGSGYLSGAATTTAYTYDATSGLKTAEDLQLQSVGSAGAISSTYTYTASGRLATATTGGVTETDTFDAAGNLTSIGTGTSLTYSGNCLSTMTAGGSTTYYFFDSSKKWRTVQAPTNSQSDGNRTAFSYTGTGRLATWTKYTGGTASTTATYTYDAQGQRTKSVVAVTGGLSTTTDFNYTGLQLQSLSASQSGTGATSWKITYLYDENGRPYAGVYRNPGTSTAPVVFGLVTTDRGDVVELLDVYGQPFAAYRYDAWGNPQGSGNVGTGVWSQQTTYNQTTVISSSVAIDIAGRQVLRYAGYCWDAESGLYYLSARSYDPKSRQFLSKDLSRNDGEQSAYQYCLGNPVRGVDPTGYAVINDGNSYEYSIYSGIGGTQTNYAAAAAAGMAKADAEIAKNMSPSERVTEELDRARGKSVVFPDLNSTDDYTEQLADILRTDAGRVLQRMDDYGRNRLLDLWVAIQVRGGGPWDFKLAVPQEWRDRAYVKFGNQMISPEDFGNIHFGFVGRAAGMGAPLMQTGSFAVNLADNGLSGLSSSGLRREIRGEQMIQFGVNLYNAAYNTPGASPPSMTYDYYSR